MKLMPAVLIITSSALAGCGSVRLVPPADVPSATVEAPADPAWRPYSSGPMQATTSGIRTGSQGSWGGRPAQKRTDTVTRAALPDAAPGMEETVTRETVQESVTDDPGNGSAGSRVGRDAGWKPYAAPKAERVVAEGTAVFGKGVSSSWAREYVPDSHRVEFGIFAKKAAADGQARMVMPTGQVYSASVIRRNGPCVTLEIGVTEGGDLPIIARGPAEVCK